MWLEVMNGGTVCDVGLPIIYRVGRQCKWGLLYIDMVNIRLGEQGYYYDCFRSRTLVRKVLGESDDLLGDRG